MSHEIRTADTADRSVDVHWTIGSGKRGRSYAFESEGMLFQSPISWYSQRGIWDMSPGFAAEMPSRFDRRLLDGCIACHVGRANPQPGVLEQLIKNQRGAAPARKSRE